MDGTIRTRRFTLDRDLYLKATWLRGFGGRAVLLAVFLAAMVGITLAMGQRSVALGAAVGAGIAWPLALVGRYYVGRRKLYGPAVKQAFDDPRTMEFTDEGFSTQTEGGVSSSLPWSYVQKAEPKNGLILLSVGGNTMAFPEAAFLSETDRIAFRALLRAKGLLKKTAP